MANHFQGATVKITATIVDEDGAAASPGTSTKISIWDSDEVAQATSQDMTEDATGSYSYYFDIDAADLVGQWSYSVVAIDNSKTSEVQGVFQVIERNR